MEITMKKLSLARILVIILLLATGGHALAQDKSGDYQLGSGDSIRILVFQNPDLTMEGRVSESGTVNYPLIGTVKLGGLTIGAAEKEIARLLKAGGFVQQPQVNVVLLQNRGNQVSVLGQANHPGRYPLDTFNIRLSEMIAIAGGISPTGSETVVITGTRDGKPFRKEVDVSGLFSADRMQDDIVVAPGDVIYINRAPMYYIYGEAQRPGAYRIEHNMTVQQAIANGGGPTLRGTEHWVRLHRRMPDGSLEKLSPEKSDLIQPDDVLYIRESLF
jgi:polysaccharide export outer membrane protein